MSQLTLVALYGDKCPELADFVARYQSMAAAALGAAFRPYEIRQIHATIVGLEHHADSPRENASFLRYRGQRIPMDIPGFLKSLRMCPQIPFQVRVGGFGASDRPFLSRGSRPYERSFSIQGDKAVVMGWPWRGSVQGGAGGYPPTLDAIRRGAQGFGILHAYHRVAGDVDNDLFFRVGLIDRNAIGDDAVGDLERQVRCRLGRQRPLILPMGIDDLAVAAYRDERLPLDSTGIWPVMDPRLDSMLRRGDL